MNRLRYCRGYLCGAMDKAKDCGVGWRKTIKEELSYLDIIWLDPTDKPIDIGLEDIENMKFRQACMKREYYDLIAREVSILRCVDLRMVDISDFLVVNLDYEVPTCGTWEEIFLANREKKPIIVHIEQGKKECPGWLLGTIPHQMIFSTWEEIHEYLRHIAFDPIVMTHKRWYFFNFHLSKEEA